MLSLSRGRISAAVLAVLVAVTPAAQADGLPGDRDPEFLAAVETWLGDNDADSLPALATLARGGNMAARLFLSRIEATDIAMGDYVAGLSRSERHALFRPNAGNGRFRYTWLKTESDVGNPFAGILYASQGTAIDFEAIEALLAMGEAEAAYHLIRKIAVDGSPSERERLLGVLAPDSELLPYIRAFHDDTLGTSPGHTALQRMIAGIESVEAQSVVLGDDPETQVAAKYAGIGHQAGSQPIAYDAGNRYYARIARWVMSAPAALPLANLCRRACPEAEIPTCANLSFGLIGGYYEVIRFDSPLEAVIDQARFLESERAVGMVRRRVLSAETEADAPVFSEQELKQRSACLAESAGR